jgi:two-component system cell cycle sensor histidine kinase/response regulator CckA
MSLNENLIGIPTSPPELEDRQLGSKGTLIEQAESRADQANLRTEQANLRTHQANTRTDEANTRTSQADLRTEKAEAHSDALRASEVMYRRLFEAARDGILILDIDTGRVVDVNPFLVELLGYSCGEMVGKTVGELSPFKDAVSNQAMLELLQKTGYVRYEDLPLKTRDGRTIAVEFVSNVYLVGEKKVIQCNIRDITERHRAEEERVRLESQLRQSQKLEGIGQLAGGIAHDFNNILAAIMMQTEMCCLMNSVPEEVRLGLQEIKSSVERAANLTRQLLLFSRKQVMQPQLLDLNEVVTNLTKMLRRLIREDVSLQLHLQSTPLMVYADEGMLDQVLMNLVVNARDAMPKGGLLIIETAERVIRADLVVQHPEQVPGRFAWLSVSDNGCGMSAEIQARIFEPFFTTKEAGKGTGLGLATVFGIVKQHQGWLKVASEIGHGSVFQVFLPVCEVVESVQTKRVEKSKPIGGTETILLAEDDRSLRLLTQMLLRRNGYQVLLAGDGVEAERIWTEHQGEIALLLTDLVMPAGMDGLELGARLQAQKPGLKVVFTSGYSADIAGRELKLQAGQSFIAKPCPPNELLEAIRGSLDS